MGGWWRWVLVSPDGVAPSWMVGMSASVNLPLHHKVQKFSSGTGSPGWSWKKGRNTVVVWCGSRWVCLFSCPFILLYHMLWLGITAAGDEVLAWLSVCSKVQMICTWSSWCHCHPIISCFIKIQTRLTFLVPGYPGCPGKEAIKWVPDAGILKDFPSVFPCLQCCAFTLLVGYQEEHLDCKKLTHEVLAWLSAVWCQLTQVILENRPSSFREVFFQCFDTVGSMTEMPSGHENLCHLSRSYASTSGATKPRQNQPQPALVHLGNGHSIGGGSVGDGSFITRTPFLSSNWQCESSEGDSKHWLEPSEISRRPHPI